MEQSTLHSMLHERDAQISSILHQLHSISDNISSLQKELHHKSQARKHQREEHSAAIKKLKDEHAEQRAHLARYESKIKGGGGLRVHEYASLMKAANKDVESSYVIRLQAQLCRAMHSLGVMESQLALVKENCSSLIKSMKEDLSHMVDDRTRREVELMNTLAHVDAEKRAWQAEMEKKLRDQEDLLDSVRDEYEELGLEYDEEEVRRALEVQMLQEQVERVKKEKALAEKDLLAALLEREEQIGKVKSEVEELEDALKDLKGGDSEGDSDKKDGANGDDHPSNDAEKETNGGQSEKQSIQISPETISAPSAIENEQKSASINPVEADDNVSKLTSKLEETKLEEPEKSSGEENAPDVTKDESQVEDDGGVSHDKEDAPVSQEVQSNDAIDTSDKPNEVANSTDDSNKLPRSAEVEAQNDAIPVDVGVEDRKHDNLNPATDETDKDGDEDADKTASSKAAEESEPKEITENVSENTGVNVEEGDDEDPATTEVSVNVSSEKVDDADPANTDATTTTEDEPSSSDCIKNAELKEEN